MSKAVLKTFSPRKNRDVDKKREVRQSNKNKRQSVVGSVDLKSTLQTFGVASKFDAEQFVNGHFRESKVSTAEQYVAELHARDRLVKEELKSYVTQNYSLFIDTSKEIVSIESSMLKLSDMFGQYKSSIRGMSELSLGLTDEKQKGDDLQRNKSVESITLEGDLLAIEELAEDLRTLIYQRKFPQAVDAIEEVRSKIETMRNQKAPPDALEDSNESLQHLQSVEVKVDMRAGQLVDMLVDELKATSLHKHSERSLVVRYLKRLGREQSALDVVLLTRSADIKLAVRQIKFQGDISVYVNELVSCVLTGIAAVYTDVKALFNDENVISAVMVWAVKELEIFVEVFDKQAYHSEDVLGKLGQCMHHVFTAANQLEKSGLSLSFLLARLLTPGVVDVIQKGYATISRLVSEQQKEEKWITSELWTLKDPSAEDDSEQKNVKKALRITASCQFMYETIQTLLDELGPLVDALYVFLKGVLYDPVVLGVLGFFEQYLCDMRQQALSGLDDRQYLAIISNSFYIADDLVPRVSREFARHLARAIPELDTLQAQVFGLHSELKETFIQRKTTTWLENILKWRASDGIPARYSAVEVPEERMQVTGEWISLALAIIQMGNVLCEAQFVEFVRSFLSSAVEAFLTLLQNPLLWEEREFTVTVGGLKQFLLDLRFLLQCFEFCLTKPALEAYARLIQTLAELFTRVARAPVSVADLRAKNGRYDALNAKFVESLGEQLRFFEQLPPAPDNAPASKRGAFRVRKGSLGEEASSVFIRGRNTKVEHSDRKTTGAVVPRSRDKPPPPASKPPVSPRSSETKTVPLAEIKDLSAVSRELAAGSAKSPSNRVSGIRAVRGLLPSRAKVPPPPPAH